MRKRAKNHSAYALKLRQNLGLKQGEFWNRIGVTQSGGSRYETGRRISKPVAILIELAYGKKPLETLKKLRD